MAEPITKADKQDEIMRIGAELETESESRILGAMGHPGYSDAVARGVLNQWVENEINLHHALGYPVAPEEPVEFAITQPDAFADLDVRTNDGWDA